MSFRYTLNKRRPAPKIGKSRTNCDKCQKVDIGNAYSYIKKQVTSECGLLFYVFTKFVIKTGSTLRELKILTGPFLSVLFPFLGPGIPGKKTGFFQDDPKAFIGFQ